MSNNGAYNLEGVIWHQHSPRLMVKILELWPDKNIPVVDLGCGHNFYSNVLSYAGYNSIGIDGNNYDGYRNDIIKADLTKKYFDKVYDPEGNAGLIEITLRDFLSEHYTGFDKTANVISLEVGEHVPLEKSDSYLDNVCSFGGDVIMSWAVPGQAGVGHINCQTNDWAIDQMEKRGLMFCVQKTASLRMSVSDCYCTWFKNTLMYFTPKP